ncbi:uncharacterized protein LOC128652755 [Bombina bombina]|uniref:uncharacterized protein LOC128652755 n=1 Tax=Bombina bombina TaxID=8345 RepID=UPI00235A8543|nr:uncharacterized protein LOC128652755 [Bombina bombina]
MTSSPGVSGSDPERRSVAGLATKSGGRGKVAHGLAGPDLGGEGPSGRCRDGQGGSLVPGSGEAVSSGSEGEEGQATTALVVGGPKVRQSELGLGSLQLSPRCPSQFSGGDVSWAVRPQGGGLVDLEYGSGEECEELELGPGEMDLFLNSSDEECVPPSPGSSSRNVSRFGGSAERVSVGPRPVSVHHAVGGGGTARFREEVGVCGSHVSFSLPEHSPSERRPGPQPGPSLREDVFDGLEEDFSGLHGSWTDSIRLEPDDGPQQDVRPVGHKEDQPRQLAQQGRPAVTSTGGGREITGQRSSGLQATFSGPSGIRTTESTSAVAAFPGIGTTCRRGGMPVSEFLVATWGGGLAGLVKNSLAPGTWAAYSRVWLEWETRLLSQGLREGEVDGTGALLDWMWEWGVSQLSHSAMDRRLAALAFRFKLLGLGDITKGFCVRQVLKGLKKGLGGPFPDHRRPITFSLLQQVYMVLPLVCLSDFEVCLFRVAFVLAFFGAFRISELVSKNLVSMGGLAFSDVALFDYKVEIFLRRSKTDQLGKGRTVVLFPSGLEVCPWRCLFEYFQVRPVMGGSLLVHVDGRPLSQFQFRAVLNKSLCRLGFNSRDFGSHSFRIGAATEASVRGLSDSVVKGIGRWCSARYRRYVRPDLGV